jgi:hypothetical protein
VAEWLPTNDGRPLKTQDAMLDYISELLERNRLLEADLVTAVECALVR